MYKFKTIGTDPECFIFEGEIMMPAFNLLPNSKDNPQSLPGNRAVLADNAMLEFCTAPVSTKKDWLKEVEIATRLASSVLLPNQVIKFVEQAQLSAFDLSNPQALEFGCSPDLCVYNDKHESYNSLFETAVRTCGGHLHIGYDKDGKVHDRELLVQLLDIVALLPRVAAGTTESVRYKYYGQPGMYRAKSYGIEYRSLSNFWLGSKGLVSWAYEAVEKAFELLNRGMAATLVAEVTPTLRKIVADWDVATANEFCDNIGISKPILV
jgi:hypothetical protein